MDLNWELTTFRVCPVISGICLQSLYDDGTETTRRQLRGTCQSLQVASEDTINCLVDIWRGVVGRVYHYYQLSAKAYFTYLKLNSKVRATFNYILGMC